MRLYHTLTQATLDMVLHYYFCSSTAVTLFCYMFSLGGIGSKTYIYNTVSIFKDTLLFSCYSIIPVKTNTEKDTERCR